MGTPTRNLESKAETFSAHSSVSFSSLRPAQESESPFANAKALSNEELKNRHLNNNGSDAAEVTTEPDALKQATKDTPADEPEEFDADFFANLEFATLEKLRRSAQALEEYSRSLGHRQHETTRLNVPDPGISEECREQHVYSTLRGKGMIEAVFDFAREIFRQPQVFAHHYASFAGELLRIAKADSSLEPERTDRRFRDGVWQENPIYRMALQTYLAWNREVRGLIEDLDYRDTVDKDRAQFIFNQLSAALAPSNSPLNPVAVKRAYQTGGKSILHGLQNFALDLQSNHGMPRQTNEDAYELGVDLGTSPGAVVYRSKLFELIQYECADRNLVHQRPILILPPQINKFYVFDLSPRNSIVDHLRRHGFQVFIVSWKNPGRADAASGMDDYVSELDKGVEAVLEISGSKDLNVISACAGGITAVHLQAWYANQGRDIIRNHSLLVTALSIEGHPIMDLFVNRRMVEASLARSRRRGVMEGKELAHLFAWLRPTDLVWNFWVNNNLLGKEPPSMDVLFWDNDSTRLPASLHEDFVDALLNDRFAGNSLRLFGGTLDLSRISGEFYFLAGDEDYLMPWRNCYRNLELFTSANCRFVLSNSGHIQSVLRPPGIASSTFMTSENYPDSPEAWLDGAEKHRGSWWENWTEWLSTRSAGLRKPPETLGSEHYPPLCPSPGTYVLER